MKTKFLMFNYNASFEVPADVTYFAPAKPHSMSWARYNALARKSERDFIKKLHDDGKIISIL